MFSPSVSNVSPIVPRRGESLTAAIVRTYDGHKGLTQGAEQACIEQDLEHAKSDAELWRELAEQRQQLAARYAREIAALRRQIVERDELIATLMDLIEGEVDGLVLP